MLERLYHIEHPKAITTFDEVNDVQEGSEGFWISKSWLKGLRCIFIYVLHTKLILFIDWRSAKPKMHNISEGDPPPDDPDYEGHVKCEHGGLALNNTSRRRISAEVRH